MIQAKQSPQQYFCNKQTRAFFLFSLLAIHRPFSSFWKKNMKAFRNVSRLARFYFFSLRHRHAACHSRRVVTHNSSTSTQSEWKVFARQICCSLAVVVDLFGCKLMFCSFPSRFLFFPKRLFRKV